jgi:DNA-binding MarR family transcriptional regulator/GNAT superfamily N-acetyltransferase
MEDDQIRQVRRFNRVITQRAGALEDDYLRRGRPLGEARLVYEIGMEGAEVGALRARLGLDSGYASRLLTSLQAQGIVVVERCGEDGRRRRAALTARGREELAAYDRRSDSLARSLLERLGETERARLVAAMAEVERLVRAASIEIRAEPPASADGRLCLRAYFEELAERFEGGFATDEHDLASDALMTPPSGVFLVARLDGRPVGCGGLKHVDGGIGEVKRLWTDRSARRLGVARAILAALEADARRAGATTLRLDTNRVLHEAKALYARLGWREIARFNDDPVAHHWFGKDI